MAKFEFAKRIAELNFPSASFRVSVDGTISKKCKNVAKWLMDEGERLTKLSKDETMTDEKANLIISEVTKKLFRKIDELIGEGASNKIFEGRIQEPYAQYNDALDVLRFVMNEIQTVYNGTSFHTPYPFNKNKKGGKSK